MSAPWFKFYPAAWRADPALRMCSLAARGLWADMLCLMHEAAERGSLLVNGKTITDGQLAALVGVPAKEVAARLEELEDAGVFSRDNGVIFSRRMRRDTERAVRDANRGTAGGGNPEIRRGTVLKDERVRPFRRSDAPAKTRRIFDRSGGHCHWCGVELHWAQPSEGVTIETFHVDHVIAVCDGGTNDEANLVAACADCNHKRARIGWSDTNPRQQVGGASDSKAKILEARTQTREAPTQEKGSGSSGVVGFSAGGRR